MTRERSFSFGDMSARMRSVGDCSGLLLFVIVGAPAGAVPLVEDESMVVPRPAATLSHPPITLVAGALPQNRRSAPQKRPSRNHQQGIKEGCESVRGGYGQRLVRLPER